MQHKKRLLLQIILVHFENCLIFAARFRNVKRYENFINHHKGYYS